MAAFRQGHGGFEIRNSKKPSGGHPKDGKGIIQAVRFSPGADNRMRRRTSIWGISSPSCGEARSPKSLRTGQRSGKLARGGEGRYGIWPRNIEDISA